VNRVEPSERTPPKWETRKNTIVCNFDPKIPLINAYQIHEWLHGTLRLQEEDIRIIQIDETRRRVFIRFVNTERMMAVFQLVK
jgi:hypothetical protein